MLTEDGAHIWDDERIKAEIADLLPEGWSFLFGWDKSGYWKGAVLDDSEALMWEDASPAANVSLRNAYGWLFLRKQPPRTGTWAPRKELTLSQVSADAIRKSRVPDPEDLDPTELDSVYVSGHQHK